jgi:tetratricopeptide (TPR) repeat protein
MQNKRKVKILSLSCNKTLAAVLVASLALGGCSSLPVSSKAPAQAADQGAGQPAGQPPAKAVELPRDYDKALVLMQSGDYQAAIPVLQAFIDGHPDLAGPYVNLGIAYQQTAQTEAALKAFNKALQLNPANAAAHHQLGILYREQGNFEAALAAYNQALKLDNGYALAHRNIGILYDLYLQQPALAIQHYKQYLELADNGDKRVNGWVIDLERRSGTAQASR